MVAVSNPLARIIGDAARAVVAYASAIKREAEILGDLIEAAVGADEVIGRIYVLPGNE
jgi:hypothetical protein